MIGHGRKLVIYGANRDLGVMFATTGIASWATEERLINATPTVLRDGWAWIGANAVDLADVEALRAHLARMDGAEETPTKQRREGKVVQRPATTVSLADGRSPTDRLPVAAPPERGPGHASVAVAGPRRRTDV